MELGYLFFVVHINQTSDLGRVSLVTSRMGVDLVLMIIRMRGEKNNKKKMSIPKEE